MSATRLYDAGYTSLVPVIPPGAQLSAKSKIHPDNRGKVPGKKGSRGWYGFRGWQEYAATAEDAATWDRWTANVGLIADHYPGVDIDVDDDQLARVVQKFAFDHLGRAPCRLSKGTRRLLVYRAEVPFPKQVLVIEYKGQEHKVEVLGRGCQYLVHGTHPSGEEYRWAKSDLWDVSPYDLTLITAKDVQIYFNELTVALAERGVRCRIKGAHDGEHEVPAQEDLRAPDLEQLEDVVGRIKNDHNFPDRESYVAFGHAVKAAGGDEALPIFLEWAERWEGGVNDLDFAADDWARMHPPFRIGWEWLRRRAGDDAADEFEVDPAATPPLPPTISFTEEDYVASILPEIQDQVRYVPEERGGRWMVWGGHKWVEDKTLAAQRIVRGQLRRLARSMFKKSKVKGTNVEMRKALTAAARKIQSDSGIKSITSLLRALVTCTIDQFDTDPWVLNTPGRLIDLRSARSITRTPASMLAKSTAVTPADSYDPERAPQWAAFLEHLTDGDEELAGFLQRYAGYCLTGDVGEKVFVFAWGAADTGKSTFLETLSMILADYAGDVAIDSLLDVGRGRVPDDIAQLPGKRLVTAAEPQAGASWNDEMIKAMTGRDTLTVRRLWHGNFQFKAQFKLLVGGNHEPKIGRMDDAMKRRLLIAPMNNPVPREDQIENFELVLVGNEGPQVLAWMIEGCAAWQRDGLAPPEAVRSTTEAYWAAEDALSQWIEDSCELGPGHEVSRSELFGSWSSWCNARGRKPGAEADLKKYLDSRAEDLGLEDKRIGSGKNRARGYAGIRVLMDLESI